MPLPLLSSVGAVLAFSQAVAGLRMSFEGNCTDQDKQRLRGDLGSVAYFNTTSTTSFTMDEMFGFGNNWFLYLTLQDNSHLGRESDITTWIGVPENVWKSENATNMRICTATSKTYDKSLKHTNGNRTCQDVVPDDCLEGFKEQALKFDLDKDAFPKLDEDFENKCEVQFVRCQQLVSNDSKCLVGLLEGTVAPKGYGLIALNEVSYSDKDKKSLKPYDKLIEEVTPTFLVFADASRNSTRSHRTSDLLASQAICAIPNIVQHDSRRPDSAAEMLQPSFAALVVLLGLGVALI
ncbi:hypothetical protein NLG97_g10265 [Lecanicillium saksenae]|uniref:Uncharacterized protein n=1 Tax=Lecanicillium saksenae TaxID=468837 RepID=A0ACC1QF62_9HYPO|nr:hypothetical protein NLG97_g10265 [Lecanicillium saksenae]